MGDQQLKTLLTNDCKNAKEFGKSHGSDFATHEDCLKMAGGLAKARDADLKGKKGQYKAFCKEYYDHATGKKEKKEEKKGKKEEKKEKKEEKKEEKKKEKKEEKKEAKKEEKKEEKKEAKKEE